MSDSVETYKPSVGLILLESYKFWAKGRLWFNIIVGLTGGLVAVSYSMKFLYYDILGIILWGLVANAFYSTGYVVESRVIVRWDGYKSLKHLRTTLLVTGTLAYAFVTFIFANHYYRFLNLKLNHHFFY